MIELRTTDIAHGGEAVARFDGKAHFVAGAMPGELVVGEVIRDKKSWARVQLTDVLEPSPDRVAPPCRHFDECGGCQWQFADYPVQLDWKRSIVEGQLRHLGRIEAVPVRPTVQTGDPYGYRNRMDFAASAGGPALRKGHTRDMVPIQECLLMAPPLADLFETIGDLGDARGITLRVGVTTGETLAVVKGSLPAGAEGWGCPVSLRTKEGLQQVTGTGVIHEEVGGIAFRVTGDAFFQNNTPGAAVLVDLATEALAPQAHETLLDGYSGVGLFGISLGRQARRVIAVESNLDAVADFAHNAAGAGVDHRLFNSDFTKGLSLVKDPWDIAVVDPPRDGLGAAAVGALTACEPRAIAYVSCDPASLARDARLLAEAGYQLAWVAPVDMFPQTYHVETVSSFVRG
ncbi:MAG: class I SAM-dependent RNA methyltransferase [Acidimicrobiia bacterium]|nr:class I SAM-dependent RNA methyltransferase [Acidimicrobiia bacterium]